MTVASSTNRVDYTGNGSTTVFSFTFRVFAATDLVVTKADADGVETVLTLNTDYTVTGVGSYSGGSITLGSALTNGHTMTIQRVLPLTQETDLRNQGQFFAETHEDVFDRLAMINQQLQEQVDRSAKLPVTSSEDAESLVADLIRLADSADNIDTVANNISDVNTVADNIADVNAVAAVASDIPAVADVASDIPAVAGVASDIPTVAANVADITNFADVYQGAKASDPALRNNGNALQAGDLYFNTADNALRAYSGTGWVSGTAGTMNVQRFSGDGSDTTFSLSSAPAGENNTQIYISGVYQQKDTYSLSGTTITFSSAPPSGADNIEVVTISTLALGETDASLVSFLQAGAGSVERTVQAELRDRVSVKQFGAIGNWNNSAGTGADDTAAFQAAIAYAAANNKAVYVPGTTLSYKVSSTLYPKGIKIFGDGEFDSAIRYTGSGALFDGTPNVRNGVTEYEIFDFVLRDLALYGPGKAVAGTKAIAGDTYRCNFERYTIQEFYTGIETCGANVKIGKGRIANCTEGVAVRPLRILWPATTTTIEAQIDRCTVGAWVDHVYAASGGVWPQTSGYGGATNIVFKNTVIEICDTGFKVNRGSGVTFLNSYAEQCTVGYDIDQSVNPTIINHGQYLVGSNSIQFNTLAERDKGYTEVGTWGSTESRLFVGLNPKGGAGNPYELAASGVIPGRNIRAYLGGCAAFVRDPDATTKDAFWMGTLAVPGQYRWFVDPTNGLLAMNSYTDAGAFSKNAFTYNQTSGNWAFGTSAGSYSFKVAFNGGIGSVFDNSHDLGSGANRWRVVYAGTGTINTSDEREKQQIKPIDDAALRAWAKVEYCQFKFNDAVAEKGDGARWHFGVIAQRVKEAFESEGLDAFAYGLLCHDEWQEAKIEHAAITEQRDTGEIDEDGNAVVAEVVVKDAWTEVRPAGSRYGIRYEEALALECAYLRSKLN